MTNSGKSNWVVYTHCGLVVPKRSPSADSLLFEAFYFLSASAMSSISSFFNQLWAQTVIQTLLQITGIYTKECPIFLWTHFEKKRWPMNLKRVMFWPTASIDVWLAFGVNVALRWVWQISPEEVHKSGTKAWEQPTCFFFFIMIFFFLHLQPLLCDSYSGATYTRKYVRLLKTDLHLKSNRCILSFMQTLTFLLHSQNMYTTSIIPIVTRISLTQNKSLTLEPVKQPHTITHCTPCSTVDVLHCRHTSFFILHGIETKI